MSRTSTRASTCAWPRLLSASRHWKTAVSPLLWRSLVSDP
ncbi:hypothetical protein E2C01_095643 [Portunus trituberculatus]|uniref:Uncharacterized protein n=1 Tax=Portunus trituberculatus TaxID=210409 RepID=A0A5B7K0W0_PORTR|nr:hypothetical protein [Portunus trituberculatus]